MNKLLIFAALGFGAYTLYGKGKTALNAYMNLKTKVVSVRNIKPGLTEFKMNVDVLVTNPSDTAIDLNTVGLVTLKRINLYSLKGSLIGFSTPGQIILSIPARGQQLLKNVPVTLNTVYALEAISDLDNAANVTTKLEIEVGGKIVTI